ncbi:MAG: hypothetical protein ACLURV_10205 [Gallintestinimicrobium sp.]
MIPRQVNWPQSQASIGAAVANLVLGHRFCNGMVIAAVLPVGELVERKRK